MAGPRAPTCKNRGGCGPPPEQRLNFTAVGTSPVQCEAKAHGSRQIMMRAQITLQGQSRPTTFLSSPEGLDAQSCVLGARLETTELFILLCV